MSILARASIAAVLLCALLATSADAAKLRVSAGRYAHAGGTLTVRVSAAKARILLSADRRRSKDDVALRTSGRGRTVIARLPATLPAGARYVLACVKRRCAAAKTMITATDDVTKTSRALIEADVKAGRLSAAKALTFRVFALVGDARLPARYAGDVAAEEDDGVLREVADLWPTLPRSTRAALARDLARPPLRHGKPKRAARKADDDPIKGWCILDGVKDVPWKSVTAAGGVVRINWDPAHPEYAKDVAQIAADVTAAYARYKQIMGRQPLSDFKSSCWHGKDSALDIYLDDELENADAVTVPAEMRKRYTPDCDGMASFIVARPTSRTFSVRFAIAHELFHAFQNAFPEHDGCQEYRWFDEGAANWAAHSAFPLDDSEHYFTRFMTDPHIKPESRDYHTWPFVLWMERTFGDRAIRATYEQFAGAASVPALDKAIGGWRAHYLDFAKHAYNQAPVASFKDWDRFTASPQAGDPVHLYLAGRPSRTANVPVAMGARAREYHPFAITDDKLRELTFRNPLAGDPDFRAGAILTLADGRTRFDDWSGKAKVRYCRDNPNENIASLVVVYANSSIAASHDVQGNPELALRDSCDGLPWHFKILNATLRTHATGGRTASDDQLCGIIGGLPINGQTAFTAATADDIFSLDHDVKADASGALSGRFMIRAPAKFAYTVNGCEGLDTGDPIRVCSKAFERFYGGDGNAPIGFAFEAAGKNAPTATLKWSLDSARVGFFDADDSVCNVQEIWHPLTLDQTRQQVPLADFAGTDPFIVRFSGNGQWSEDSRHNPATLGYDWEYAFTLQRVDANGDPLE